MSGSEHIDVNSLLRTVAHRNVDADALKARIAELEADLTIARLQLARIADEVFDPAMDEDAMRLALQNIRYIINPAM